MHERQRHHLGEAAGAPLNAAQRLEVIRGEDHAANGRAEGLKQLRARLLRSARLVLSEDARCDAERIWCDDGLLVAGAHRCMLTRRSPR